MVEKLQVDWKPLPLLALLLLHEGYHSLHLNSPVQRKKKRNSYANRINPKKDPYMQTLSWFQCCLRRRTSFFIHSFHIRVENMIRSSGNSWTLASYIQEMPATTKCNDKFLYFFLPSNNSTSMILWYEK